MNNDERAVVASQFGVAAEQVERDHLVSHLLGFLSDNFGDRVHFIGGTALARTPTGWAAERGHRPNRNRDRQAVAADIDAALPLDVWARRSDAGEVLRHGDRAVEVIRVGDLDRFQRVRADQDEL